MGEKKSDDWLGAKRVFSSGDLGPPWWGDLRWSRDRVLPCPTALYMAPPGPYVEPGPRIVLLSLMLWAMAAFFTLRCSAYAIIARHARIHMPRKPRIAPTHMKTVPSG